MSGVTIRLAIRWSIDYFVIMSEADKHYKVKIVEAKLCVRKMILNNDDLLAIEKPLLTSPAFYLYLGTFIKHFWLLLIFKAENKETYLSGNESEDWLCVWTKRKLFSVTIDRIHFISRNSVWNRFISIKMECHSQIVQYQQMMISVFTSIQYQT